MKKTNFWGWAFVASMMCFSACSNEAEEILTQESEIKLTSEITRSRVTSDLQSEQLEEGRTIGVTITGSKSGDDYVNMPWTSDGEGGLSTTHTVYWANTNVNVTAYHPYNVDWTSGSQTFTVKTDQSVEANYLNSDLLYAKATAVAKSANPISLTFSHKLAKINVTLQPEYPEMDLSNAVISICNTKPSTTIDLSDGIVLTEATGDIQEIKAGVGSTASAIVAPQTIASSTKFIKIELGEKIFYYTLPSDKQLKSGYSHNYTLTVKETAVQIDNSSEIKDWTDDNDEGNTGDANEDDTNDITTIPNNQIWYTTKNGNIIESSSSSFNAKIKSNTYVDGKGIIEFENDVTSIENQAFYNCFSLTNITIPESVTSIGNSAFYGCSSLTNITIPESVTSIGNSAFEYCTSFTNITIPYGVTNLGSSVFSKCSSLTNITIPESVTSIVRLAFCGCSSLANITIPNSVTSIEFQAFQDCPLLTNITIPNNVTSIDGYAFCGCSSLTNITIPESVTSIGNSAFSGCSVLSSVVVKAVTPPSLGNIAFGNNISDLTIYVPATSLELYKAADYWKDLNLLPATD